MDTKILSDGFLDINLGTTMVLQHAQAILRDLSIHGIKQETLVGWLINDGRVDGKAPFTMKKIRRKEVNVTAILNAPKLLFDYFGTTRGLENDHNSIIEGITRALDATKSKTESILEDLLKTIIVTGPGAHFKGIDDKIREELGKIYSNHEINVILGDDPLNSVSNGLLQYLSIYPKLKAFNLSVDEKEIVLEQTDEEKLKIASRQLSSLKNYFLDLSDLVGKANEFEKVLENLPEKLKSVMNINILQESKSWSLELNKILNPLLKDAKKGLKETEEVAVIFRSVGVEISKLPKFIRPTLAKVFTANVQGLKTIKEIHIRNSKRNTVDSLHNANLQVRDEYSLDDLANATNFDKSKIIELLDEYLSAYPDFGYLNENFIKFSKEKLKQAEKILDILTDKYFEAFMVNSKEKRDKYAKQGLECCKFLIKGYFYLNKPDLVEKFESEKETFENEFSKKSEIFL
jgi:hypothetical protein